MQDRNYFLSSDMSRHLSKSLWVVTYKTQQSTYWPLKLSAMPNFYYKHRFFSALHVCIYIGNIKVHVYINNKDTILNHNYTRTVKQMSLLFDKNLTAINYSKIIQTYAFFLTLEWKYSLILHWH